MLVRRVAKIVSGVLEDCSQWQERGRVSASVIHVRADFRKRIGQEATLTSVRI
jgi:hypothetical protein